MDIKKEIKKIAKLQWRWIFGIVFAVINITSIAIFFAISIYVAAKSTRGETVSNAEITQISDTLGIYVGPFFFLALSFISTNWLGARVSKSPRLHGIIIGFLLGFITIILDLIFSPSLELFELFANLTAIPIGWLGGARGAISLKNREAVYRTSQAIRGQDKIGMLKAIGEQLASPSVTWIAFVDEDGKLDSASGWVASSRQKIPESIPPFRTQPELATLIETGTLPQPISGTRSILALPLSKMDEILLIASRNKTGFSRIETQNYQTIAEQVSLSLENFQLLEKAREAGIIQERQRLAAEIHDGLTQGFVSIVMQLEVAEAKMESHAPEVRDDFQALLNQVRQTARDNLTASRKMTWALRPDLLESVPLPDALENLAKRWASTNNIPVTFSYSGNLRQLHPDIETVLLRTLREALNNIQKHAKATQVTATLTYLDTLVALDIQDNGKGFDLAAHSPTDADGGFGLKSLHEQAERLGGELSIESEVNKGSTIAIAIPDSVGEKL